MSSTSSANIKRKKNKQKSTKKNQKSTKKCFSAQVNCICNKNCAQRIDVVIQREIFDQYYGSTWSEQTEFLRSITKRDSVKENLNPRVNLKNREFFSCYHFTDASGEVQRVCLSFVTKVLQINRVKVHRAVSSIKNNPFAVDRRGKLLKPKTTIEDAAFAKQFIESFPQYESKIDSNSLDVKYLHPSLTLNTIYRLYGNTCEFKQKKKLSQTVFMGIFRKNFPHLHAFKSVKSKCSKCESINKQKKVKVLSPETMENVQKAEDDHLAALREFKDEFINNVNDPEYGVEIFTFELQRPLQMPLLPIDESYDLRCLWLSNLCVFNELNKRVHMYVWDEMTAKRGPEEIGSCLYKHVGDVISNSTKKIILYADAMDLYRNLHIAVMLGKIIDFEESELQSIEIRFFFSGHGKNDCNRCFDTIETKIKNSQNLFTPDDWIELISSAKSNFNVNKMSRNDFMSTDVIMMQTIGGEIDWSDVKAMIFNRSEPLNIRLKYFSRSTEEIIPMYKDTDSLFLVNKSNEDILVTKAKHDDLMETLKYVPAEKCSYYENIQHDDNSKEADFALASYTL